MDTTSYRNVNEAVIAELRTIVGDARVLVDRDVVEPYSHDETVGLQGQPEVVVRADSAEQVSAIFRLAQRILNPGKIFP
jgi:glycolate oxidase